MTNPADTPRPTATVLVVDDEPIVLQVARGLLARAGYRAVIASTGPVALRLLREEPVAALLDLTLPGQNTPAILRAMRLAKPNVPVVMCTGQDIRYASDVFSGPERGPDGFLQKPFTGAELAAAIHRAMTRRRSGSDRQAAPTR